VKLWIVPIVVALVILRGVFHLPVAVIAALAALAVIVWALGKLPRRRGEPHPLKAYYERRFGGTRDRAARIGTLVDYVGPPVILAMLIPPTFDWPFWTFPALLATLGAASACVYVVRERRAR
jgi:hypothetical protein